MQSNQLYSPNWTSAVVDPVGTVRNALEAISRSGSLMACAVNSEGVLLGILTDSDVRRYLLSGGTLEDSLSRCLNRNPVVALAHLAESDIVVICETNSVRELPICSASGVLVDIFILGQHARLDDEIRQFSAPGVLLSSPVFICAGGKGTRLSSIVSDRPKPLALVGGKPLLETVIAQATREGFRNFYVSVNHMSEMIEEHLAQQHYSNLSITIVREDKALGTAGAIGYISERVTEPLLVTNADVLTTVPYSKIVREHKKSETWLTCAVRPHHYTVPFGIVHVENQRVSEVSEKPTYSWLANSGIYVLSPEACREVKKDVRLDMPELMNWGIRNGKRVVPFVLHEYWMDVGQPEDFRKANTEFKEYFGE